MLQVCIIFLLPLKACIETIFWHFFFEFVIFASTCPENFWNCTSFTEAAAKVIWKHSEVDFEVGSNNFMFKKNLCLRNFVKFLFGGIIMRSCNAYHNLKSHFLLGWNILSLYIQWLFLILLSISILVTFRYVLVF